MITWNKIVYYDDIYTSDWTTTTNTATTWYTTNEEGKWVVLKNRNEEQEKLKEIENMKEYEDLFE
jgi:hypothetical protein